MWGTGDHHSGWIRSPRPRAKVAAPRKRRHFTGNYNGWAGYVTKRLLDCEAVKKGT